MVLLPLPGCRFVLATAGRAASLHRSWPGSQLNPTGAERQATLDPAASCTVASPHFQGVTIPSAPFCLLCVFLSSDCIASPTLRACCFSSQKYAAARACNGTQCRDIKIPILLCIRTHLLHATDSQTHMYMILCLSRCRRIPSSDSTA